jgi:hypothetical protein
MTIARPLVASLVALPLALTPTTHAQCAPTWQPSFGLRGINGGINAMTWWDPDGAGPQARLLVIAGEFNLAGATPANNIAAWDGSRWLALGPAGSGAGSTAAGGGTNGRISHLLVMPDNTLAVVGPFTRAGGVTVSRAARWNGAAWLAMGTQPILTATAATVAGGELFLAGVSPAFIGGNPFKIIKWNGTAWEGVANVAGSTLNVDAMTELPGGDLAIAGSFTSVNGVNAANVARRSANGTWSAFGSGLTNGFIRVLAVRSNGELLAGSNIGFSDLPNGLANGLARWNGTNWAVVPGAPTGISVIKPLPGADLLVAGNILVTSGSQLVYTGLARLTGTTWSGFTNRTPRIISTVELTSDNRPIVGSLGSPPAFFGPQAAGIALWSGSAWEPLADSGVSGPGPFGSPVVGSRVVADSNGQVIAVGEVTLSDSERRGTGLSRWTGTQWQELAGVQFAVQSAVTAAPLRNGKLFISGVNLAPLLGELTLAPLARNAVLWTGTQLQVMGDGLDGRATDATESPAGDIYVVGNFTTAGGNPAAGVARWNGSVWSALGTGVVGQPRATAWTTGGRLIVGGSITSAGGTAVSRIAQWDGTAWSALGTGIAGTGTVEVRDILALANGDVLVGGLFTSAGGVSTGALARWNGGTWSSVGPALNSVDQIALDGQGRIVVLGTGTGVSFPTPLRLDGNTWTVLGAPNLRSYDNATGSGLLNSMAVSAGGDVFVGGLITEVSGVRSVGVGRLAAACGCGPSDVAGAGQQVGPDGEVTADDVIVFINWFVTGDARADVGRAGQVAGADGELTADDVIVFINRFIAGC